MKKIIFSAFILLMSNLSFAANDAFEGIQNRANISFYGGYSKVSEDYGFGGNKSHFGLDVMFYFSKNWFLDLNFHGVDMGESINTNLTQSAFHVGAGYRCHGLRTWVGLGGSTQSKEINSPSFFYVDPAPNTSSRVTVDDQFFSWALALAYDFVLTEPTESFPWHFAIAPHLHLTDTFENNGFEPIFSAGISLSLL